METPLTNRVREPYCKLRTQFVPLRFMAQKRKERGSRMEGRNEDPYLTVWTRKTRLVKYLLLRSLSEAATLFLKDRVEPERFIICDLSRSDFFRWRWFWVAAVRWISDSSFRIVRAHPTWSPTDLSSIRWVHSSFFTIGNHTVSSSIWN